MTLFDSLAQLTRDQVETLHGEDVLLYVPTKGRVPEERVRFDTEPLAKVGVFHFDSETDREQLRPSPMREVSRAPSLHRGDQSTVSIAMPLGAWTSGTLMKRTKTGDWFSMFEPVPNDLGQVSFLIQQVSDPFNA